MNLKQNPIILADQPIERSLSFLGKMQEPCQELARWQSISKTLFSGVNSPVALSALCHLGFESSPVSNSKGGENYIYLKRSEKKNSSRGGT